MPARAPRAPLPVPVPVPVPVAGDRPATVSLVGTVLNESASIDALLASVARQTRAPDDIVIVDGGSSDGTWERLQAWTARLPLRALRRPGATIARGRNQAVAAAAGDLVAVTDAGVRLDERWLEALTAGVHDGVDVVAGFFVPDAQSLFERAMGATVLPARSDVAAATFLPSSRSILFRHSAWAAIGGYPEWLDYCEDLVFDLALKRAGCDFAFAPDAVVYVRPRSSLVVFFRQYYLYARGDGKADLWRQRHAVRYAAYLGALALAWRALRRPPIWGIVVLGGLAYTRRPLARLMPDLEGLAPGEVAYAVALVPIIRLVGDVAKMVGYPVGVVWRWRHRPSA